MKLRVVVVDLELTGRQKRACSAALALAGAFAASVALADVPKTFVVGETLKAADLNANFADHEDRLTELQDKVHEPSAFRAQRTSSLSVPHSTATALVFDAEIFDLANEYNPATGVFTAAAAGTYLVSCSVFLATPGSAGAVYAIAVNRNGAQLQGADYQASADKGLPPTIGFITQLAAGDQLSCQFYQDSGASLTINPSFFERTAFAAARLN